jgi:hypothetical protein
MSLPQYVADRLNTTPPAALKRGDWYICPVHCGVCMGYDWAHYRLGWGITEQQYGTYIRKGKIKHNDYRLDEEGLCQECERGVGQAESQAELDRREIEAGLAIERAYEEQDDYSPDYYEAQNNLERALNGVMGYESPEQRRRNR